MKECDVGRDPSLVPHAHASGHKNAEGTVTADGKVVCIPQGTNQPISGATACFRGTSSNM